MLLSANAAGKTDRQEGEQGGRTLYLLRLTAAVGFVCFPLLRWYCVRCSWGRDVKLNCPLYGIVQLCCGEDRSLLKRQRVSSVRE